MSLEDPVATVFGPEGQRMDLSGDALLAVKQQLLAAASYRLRHRQGDATASADREAEHAVQMRILSATEDDELRWGLVAAATQILTAFVELANEAEIDAAVRPWLDDFGVEGRDLATLEPAREAEPKVAIDHATLVHETLPEQVDLAREAVAILGGLLDRARQETRLDEEVNSLAGWLCLRRSLEQLRLAFYAAIAGHHTEVPLLARAVYESAGLARMLAVEPDDADNWVHDPPWQKDKHVRDWIRARGGDADAYAEYYAQASELAHTKLISMRPLLPELEAGSSVGSIAFDPDIAASSLGGVLSAGLFAIHCYRNAGISDDLIHPPLWRRIVDLHEAAGGVTDHLDQDWEAIERRRVELARRVNRAAGISQRLDEDPLSYRKLRGDARASDSAP